MRLPISRTILKPIIFGLFSLLLIGCTQQAASVKSTVSQAILGNKDIDMSKEQIAAIPYASQYVRINNGPQIFTVLTFADTDHLTGQLELKWASSDLALLVTTNGMLTKTVKLSPSNIKRTLDSDIKWQEGITFISHYDWPEKQIYDLKASSTLHFVADEPLDNGYIPTRANHWIETVTFPELNKSMTNHYWVNAAGRIIKSIQSLGPDMTTIELEEIKSFGGA